MNRYKYIITSVLTFLFLTTALSAQQTHENGIVDEGPEHHLLYQTDEIESADLGRPLDYQLHQS